MKELMLMYARDAKRADEAVLELLDRLSEEARNQDRKSYYKSLSGLMSHTLGGAPYFHSMFRAAFPAASGALKATEGLAVPEGEKLDGAQWAELRKDCALADQATIDFIASLEEEELMRPIPLDWYGGKPAAVPLYFLLCQSFTHGVHHRGQISQILDSMGIEHDFSGIDVAFLPR
jgi:uncharacterized damage-inducible protein DinB